MNILAIDTSCDETAASVTTNLQVVSNIVWSQSTSHASFGGVFPSLAQRMHKERIDEVVKHAMSNAKLQMSNIDAIAVTVGPGLAVALAVGVNYAKELALKHKKPLIPVNHIEAHLLSPLATNNSKFNSEFRIQNLKLPSFGLILSGGTTLLCLVKNIGEYEVLAKTSDDALGEALDKAARQLGLGYPGGPVLEKFARLAKTKQRQTRYVLPTPLTNDVIKNRFSYSGLKTAFVRLFESIKSPDQQDIYDLAAVFQDTAFSHIEKVLEYQIINHKSLFINHLLFGGGVANNIELRKRLRKVCKKYDIKLLVPYTKKLNGDNAGMIGVCAYLKNNPVAGRLDAKFGSKEFIESIDINPKLSI